LPDKRTQIDKDQATLRVRALLRLVFHAPIVGGAIEDALLARIGSARLLILAAHG
jgi:hypothetical protein